MPVDGRGSLWAPDPAGLDGLEPFGQGFPPALLVLEGTLAKPPHAFGQGHLKLHLEGERDPLTWFFAAEQELGLAAQDRVRLAATPQDHPRWGRSWIVDGAVGEEVALP
jgi:hypothetical protein